MRSWDMAKLLMECCDSPEDVGQVIATLSNPAVLQEVCSMLAPFSNAKPEASDPETYVTKKTGDSRRASVHTSTQQGSGKGTKVPPKNSRVAATVQLESLFRSSGMTNKQVERWVDSNFNVDIVVGKGSLHQYLTRVLNRADLGMINRMLSAAQRLLKDEPSGASDIRNYWDELEKRSTIPQ